MSLPLSGILLIALFLGLGFCADLIADHARKIAHQLCVPVFALGIMLAVVTSLPELSLGLNAAARDVSSIAFGNLLGGVLVLFGLVFGLSAVLNRGIKTPPNQSAMAPIAITMILPLFFGLDGTLGATDGFVLMAAYIISMYFMYRAERGSGFCVPFKKKESILKSFTLAAIGTAGVIIISDWILDISMGLLEQLNVSYLLIGSILFSLGTNLPEIAITISSIRRKVSDLSVSHLIGSALLNTFILGLISVMFSVELNVRTPFFILGGFFIAIVVLFARFYATRHVISRTEGLVLVTLYLSYLVANAWLVT